MLTPGYDPKPPSREIPRPYMVSSREVHPPPNIRKWIGTTHVLLLDRNMKIMQRRGAARRHSHSSVNDDHPLWPDMNHYTPLQSMKQKIR